MVTFQKKTEQEQQQNLPPFLNNPGCAPKDPFGALGCCHLSLQHWPAGITGALIPLMDTVPGTGHTGSLKKETSFESAQDEARTWRHGWGMGKASLRFTKVCQQIAAGLGGQGKRPHCGGYNHCIYLGLNLRASWRECFICSQWPLPAQMSTRLVWCPHSPPCARRLES